MRKTSILLAAVLVACASSAQAKWWIFGGSGEGVTLKYLYFNGISSDDGGAKLTFYRSATRDGAFKITGRASAKGSVGYVRVSLDGKKTWSDAKVADNGAFEYSFPPEAGKTFDFYLEAADTAGKVNDVEATHRQLVFSDEDVAAQVKDALDKIIDAYKSKDPKRFMALVGEDFTGDSVLLERAIRKDFSALDNIDLRFSISNVAQGAKGTIAVGLTFNRFVVLTKSGQSQTDNGSTEIVFQPGPGGLKIYRMKNPLMFGLSDPDNVATGTVPSGGTTLTLDDSGGAANILTAAVKDHNNGFQQSFGFVGGTVNEEPVGFHVTLGDFSLNGVFVLKSGVLIQDLGIKSLSSVTAAPQSGYSAFAHSAQGHCFAFQLTGGKFAVMEITGIVSVGGETRYDFKYRVF